MPSHQPVKLNSMSHVSQKPSSFPGNAGNKKMMLILIRPIPRPVQGPVQAHPVLYIGGSPLSLPPLPNCILWPILDVNICSEGVRVSWGLLFALGWGLKKICFVTIADCCQVGLACDCYFGISVCRSSSSGTITALAILGMGAHLRPSLWPYWLSIPWVAIPNSGHLLGPQFLSAGGWEPLPGNGMEFQAPHMPGGSDDPPPKCDTLLLLEVYHHSHQACGESKIPPHCWGGVLSPQQSPFPYCLPDKALPEGWKSSFSPPLATFLSRELTCKNPLHGPNTLYFIFLIGGNCIRYSLPVQLKVCFMLSQVYIKLCFKEKLFFKMPTEV